MSQWIDVTGLVFGFLGPLILMVTTGSEKAGAVHSWSPPRWAHYTGWSLLALGFFLQLGGRLIPDNQLPAIAPPSRTLHKHLLEAGVFSLGLLAAQLLGLRTRTLLEEVPSKPNAPDGISPEELNKALLIGEEDEKTARIIGWMERALFFFSIYFEAYLLAGGWLTLKVASKWAIWQNIVKMPDNFPYNPDDAKADVLKALRVKNQWGGRLLNRFMLGTFYNLMCGLCGALVSWSIRALFI
jgi:hypothetical protein